MPTTKPDRSLIALVAGFAALAITVLAAIALVQQQQRAFTRVTHTLRVENQLSLILARVQGAESGQRGFILTGNDGYLEPYHIAAARLPGDLAALRALVADNPDQAAAAKRLSVAALTRQDALSRTLAVYYGGDETGVRMRFRQGQGKAAMDDLRQIVGGMQATEARLQQARADTARRWASAVVAALAASTVAILAVGLLAFRDARRRLALAVQTGEALGAANNRLMAEAAHREVAESQVRQMQKMEAVGQLTGGIAHDFNNMLAIVIGSLDIAKRRLATDPARVAVCLDNALDGAQRAAELTGRLLAFSRQQPLAPRVLDANRLVSGMSDMLRRTVGEHLKVETVLAAGLWNTSADASQLENAILNLCVNGRDAMPRGGRLTLETRNADLDDAYASAHPDVTPGQYVMISVTDTGVGMPAEVVARAFDPFYTTKGVGRGTGLGLSQVYGFVKQSGGHIRIDSEPGAGTTVELYLPRSQAAAATPGPIVPAPVVSPRAVDGEVVLLVEDETSVRRVSVEALRDLGYTVVHAPDGARALIALDAQPRVDLLFTDIVMPDMNGRELADETLRRRPEVKVLYTTGYTRNAIVHDGMLDAGVAFLPKPFTFSQLATKVRQVLDGAGANRA
ncbi:CHASE3 domain-containing protein [Phenylobacterium sp.]|uniref:CHASE3 domain-containing protein n=1 Tax=Phenylobacterium sp. TaxID=1871053 RepID=UPI00286A6642|nr:CHASE3 domain-containing protein [Phenylobacterium sp.]